jgi:hypothetical protein
MGSTVFSCLGKQITLKTFIMSYGKWKHIHPRYVSPSCVGLAGHLGLQRTVRGCQAGLLDSVPIPLGDVNILPWNPSPTCS